MNSKKANEIMEKLIAVWKKREPKKILDKLFVESLRLALLMCPDDDGLKRVVSVSTGKTHLVPYHEIMLNGLKGSDLHKYPEEKMAKKVM